MANRKSTTPPPPPPASEEIFEVPHHDRVFIGDKIEAEVVRAVARHRVDEIKKSLARAVTDATFRETKLVISFALRENSIDSVPQSCPTSKLLDMFVPIELASDMQANLEDMFPTWVERHGFKWARRIYRGQVGLLVLGRWLNKALEVGERLAKIVKFTGS